MILRKETFYPKEALEAILSYFQENSAFFAEIAKIQAFVLQTTFVILSWG